MTDPAHERRHTRRRDSIADHGIVSARVRAGRDASVVDVSAGGALVETCHRLLPGTEVDLHLETPSRRVTVRGRVLRCAVSRLRSSSVCYRGAIAFDRQLPWMHDADGYPVPSGDQRSGRVHGAASTPELI